MDTGIQVINQNNFIQIDSNYGNYMLTETILVPCSQSYGFGYIGQLLLTDAHKSLVALEDPSVAFMLSAIGEGSVTRINFYKHGTGGNLKVRVFRATPPVSGSSFGFQVFSSDGALVFDALSPSMKILDVIDRQLTGGSSTRIYPTANKVAVVISVPAYDFGYLQITTESYIYMEDCLTVSVSGNSVTTAAITSRMEQETIYPGFPPRYPETVNRAGHFIVIDTSGID